MFIHENHNLEPSAQKIWLVSPTMRGPELEFLERLAEYNAEGRPIWQPMYRNHVFITVDGSGRCRTNGYIPGGRVDVGADIFNRGLCLSSDNKMTDEQQDMVIELVRGCFE